ncbi:hypothetical protein [Nitrosospira multiformis]|uniref:hypothetical protein n=1 Tax=Nitrosospira multiformis TaxID=1231 RepID=UPI0015A3D54F|nr:hypothetical protein [Nitrosospira multiformis]
MMSIFRSILFGGLLFFSAAVLSPPIAADMPGDERPSPSAFQTLIASHQNAVQVDCQEATSGNAVSPNGKAAAGHENAPEEGQAAEKSTAPCPQDIEPRKDLLHRILRFFVAPAPSPPNPDVDTNISAGGAGGG